MKLGRQRKNTKVYESDALACDYERIFEENNMPEVIDFLNVDLDPPDITLDAFKALPHHKYKFRTIIFETDSYRMAMGGENWNLSQRENGKITPEKLFRPLGMNLSNKTDKTIIVC